jgi:uncharacterized protein
MKKYILLLMLIFLAGAFFLRMSETKVLPENITHVTLAGQKIKVDLAISPEAQIKGLSGRDGLAEGEGMLFIFNDTGAHFFWMKDMKFAIDILWLNEETKVVHIKESVTPESYPETFGSDEPAKYVLELPAGFTAKYGIKEGDQAVLTD